MVELRASYHITSMVRAPRDTGVVIRAPPAAANQIVVLGLQVVYLASITHLTGGPEPSPHSRNSLHAGAPESQRKFGHRRRAGNTRLLPVSAIVEYGRTQEPPQHDRQRQSRRQFRLVAVELAGCVRK